MMTTAYLFKFVTFFCFKSSVEVAKKIKTGKCRRLSVCSQIISTHNSVHENLKEENIKYFCISKFDCNYYF